MSAIGLSETNLTFASEEARPKVYCLTQKRG